MTEKSILAAQVMAYEDYHEEIKLARCKLNEKLIKFGLKKDVKPLDYRVKSLKKAICLAFEIPVTNLKEKNRNRETHIYPRTLFCYICRVHYDRIYKKIGEDINRDHSSVLHAVTRGKNFLSERTTDQEFFIKFLEVKKTLLDRYDIHLD